MSTYVRANVHNAAWVVEVENRPSLPMIRARRPPDFLRRRLNSTIVPATTAVVTIKERRCGVHVLQAQFAHAGDVSLAQAPPRIIPSTAATENPAMKKRPRCFR